MATALAIVNLLNTATPGIANLILLIRNKDGTVTVAQMLDQNDAQFDKNMAEAADWFKAHPTVKPVTA
jgi:hypothetical protein